MILRGRTGEFPSASGMPTVIRERRILAAMLRRAGTVRRIARSIPLGNHIARASGVSHFQVLQAPARRPVKEIGMKRISGVRAALAVISMGLLAIAGAPQAMAKHADKERSRDQGYRQSGGDPNSLGGWLNRYNQGYTGTSNDRNNRDRDDYRRDNGRHRGWYKGNGNAWGRRQNKQYRRDSRRSNSLFAIPASWPFQRQYAL